MEEQRKRKTRWEKASSVYYIWVNEVSLDSNEAAEAFDWVLEPFATVVWRNGHSLHVTTYFAY